MEFDTKTRKYITHPTAKWTDEAANLEHNLMLTSTAPSITSDKTSFAYISARDRWPVILTGAIDDVHRAVSEASGDKKTEGKRIIEELAKLKYELQHDRKLTYVCIYPTRYNTNVWPGLLWMMERPL